MKFFLGLALSTLLLAVKGDLASWKDADSADDSFDLPHSSSVFLPSQGHHMKDINKPNFLQNLLFKTFQEKAQDMKTQMNGMQKKALDVMSSSIEFMMPRWTYQFQDKVSSYALDLEASKGTSMEQLIQDPKMKREIIQHVQGLWKDTVNSNLALLRNQFLARFSKLTSMGSQTRALAKRDETDSLPDFLIGFFTVALTIIIGLPVFMAMFSVAWVVCQARKLRQGFPDDKMDECMNDFLNDTMKRVGA